MLENYEKLDDGRIKQIKSKPFVYDFSYSNVYNSEGYLLNSKLISYLRFGYLVGSIGKIPESILDVGYGNGQFLSVCFNQISECFGYDVSDYETPVGIQRSESMFDRFYDVITFFDSLEHFNDISFVKDLKCNYVCISLPYCHYFSDEWFKIWKHRKPDEHLWHFNESALITFMQNSGYTKINISNIEDNVRKSGHLYQNILVGIFKKNN